MRTFIRELAGAALGISGLILGGTGLLCLAAASGDWRFSLVGLPFAAVGAGGLWASRRLLSRPGMEAPNRLARALAFGVAAGLGLAFAGLLFLIGKDLR